MRNVALVVVASALCCVIVQALREAHQELEAQRDQSAVAAWKKQQNAIEQAVKRCRDTERAKLAAERNQAQHDMQQRLTQLQRACVSC